MTSHPVPIPKIKDIQNASAEYIKFIQVLANSKGGSQLTNPLQINKFITRLTEEALHLVATNSSSVKTCYKKVLKTRYNSE